MGVSIRLVDAEGFDYDGPGMSITYNYSKWLSKTLHAIDGANVKDAIPLARECQAGLTGEPSRDYWEATEGNAKAAMAKLLVMLEAASPLAYLSMGW